ncbi:hypothetical protein RBH26_12630 [Natronolimnohabitans sp. A-GB9]|uniref:hypothetical protein n=1 Tax=Natronolimnohabitans sp. A-GB9 TaxID=3069757 RepID=UPI0027B35AF7|nr:hypothetical protein [Natronolimnohabitans sp. A-GB9]MDQ2051325.1 hypothetical protein [Natronolimnohabitans sp. A-GB9]
MLEMSRETTRILELCIGAIIVGSLLTDVFVYPLYDSNTASLLIMVWIPTFFAAVVLFGTYQDGISVLNILVGICAGATLAIGLWSIAGFYFADAGVFFGGIITTAAAVGLFAIILLRELVWHVVSSDGTTLLPI